jgi:hypothetical protein
MALGGENQDHRRKVDGELPPVHAAIPPISDTRVDEAVRCAAIGMLNAHGARQFYLNGIFTIGLWADEDKPEVRAAISTLHSDGVQVLHLEDARVPERYRQVRLRDSRAAEQPKLL